MKLLLLIGALYALPHVSISVYPSVGMSPFTVRITVLVPRHLDNRHLCFGYSGNEDKVSCMDLAGMEARRSWTVYWSLRTPGEYQAEAVLTRMEAGRTQTYRQSQPFRVLGFELEH
jgi:hypothetical protein